MGFEPITSCLLDRRSNQLSYDAMCVMAVLKNFKKCQMSNEDPIFSVISIFALIFCSHSKVSVMIRL